MEGGSGISRRFEGLVDRCGGVGCGLSVVQAAWLSAQSLLVAVLRSLVARQRFGPRARWRPLCGALTDGLGLDGLYLAWPAVVRLLVFIYSFTRWSWP